MTGTAPERIGPYRVLRSIAKGGMAEVFEVEDPASGEHLALKLLTQTGTAFQRFNREYEAMIRLNHPNIVRVYHYGFHEQMPWLTMELLDGTPVQVYARDAGKPGDPARMDAVLRIGHDIARALDHIHRRGLVHRDLKSANVLVLADGRVKLLDFGTAKVADAVERITKDGEFLGTFAYAPPEQITGRALDHRADLYALGVLLYRLFTGVLPFQTDDPNEMARLQMKATAKPMSDVVPDMPARLDAIVAALLEKRPGRRPESGGVVADWLEEVAGRPLVIPGTLELKGSRERLVGREEQLAVLRKWLDAKAPGGMAVVLGAPASGRERILHALEDEARARKWRQHALEVRPGSDVAELGTMLSQIGDAMGEGASEPARSATAAVRRATDSHTLPSAKRRELLRQMGALLLAERAKKDGKPVLVQLRSLHHASPELLDVVEALADHFRASGVPVLFLADADETADDPGERLFGVFPGALRVTLPPLDPRQTALVVGALLLRRPPPAVIARQILEASGGEPAYIEGVVRELVDGGLLKVQGRDDNRLEWAKRDIAVRVPQQARVDLEAALAALPYDRRRVLEALALVGEDATDHLLAHAMDRAVEEVWIALEDLRTRGLVTLEDLGADGLLVRWRHRLVPALVIGQLRPCRRDVFRRRLVERLANAPVSPALVGLLLEVGRTVDAVMAALGWAEFHLAAGRPATALEALDRVAGVAEGADLDRADVARLHLLHASCLLLARPTDPQTARSMQRAAALGEGPMFAGRLSLLRARVQRTIGHYPNYRAQLAEAWKHVTPLFDDGGPPALQLGAEVAEHLSTALHMAGLVEEAGDWCKRARALVQHSGEAGANVEAEVQSARLYAARGRLGDAEKLLGRIAQRCEKEGDLGGLVVALPAWADLLRHAGRYSEALDALGRVLPTVRQGEAPSHYVRLLLATAWCEIELCRLGRAQECVEELAATVRRGEHLHLRLEADLVVGRIHLLSGNLREARDLIGTVVERAKTAELVLLAEHARALHAETLWSLGKYDVAAREFEAARGRLSRAGDQTVLVQACQASARAMASSADPAALFAPVHDYVEKQPAYVARLEWHLATGRYLRALQQDPKPAYQRAKDALDRIAKKLDDTDRAALRVHPWSREIRAGGVEV